MGYHTLMSSENKITDDDGMGGAKVRAIDISAIKIVRDKEAVERFESDYQPGKQAHYGVIAPILIRKIINEKEKGTLTLRYSIV